MTPEKIRQDRRKVQLKSAIKVARLFWPSFVREHGCVFLAWHSGSNPPPPGEDATGWESFVSHTHVFDEFVNTAIKINAEEQSGDLVVQEVTYEEAHPDFIRGCELGAMIAAAWASKLKLDFPTERFRVYYTEYDNPIVRFHKARPDEPFWLSDDTLQTSTDPSFRNALVYDTSSLSKPIRAVAHSIQ
jgi:hypothetical protein